VTVRTYIAVFCLGWGVWVGIGPWAYDHFKNRRPMDRRAWRSLALRVLWALVLSAIAFLVCMFAGGPYDPPPHAIKSLP